MGAPVVYVMTHDSIGLGEDGPTHQPVEHLASLGRCRTCVSFAPAMPSRRPKPGNSRRAAPMGPTLIALTRQNLPQLRTDAGKTNRLAEGAYEILKARAARPRLAVRLRLGGRDCRQGSCHAAGKRVFRPASSPCPRWSCSFHARRRTRCRGWRRAGQGWRRGGGALGWDAIIGQGAPFIGMCGFGASAPAKDLYKHFGITAEAVTEAVMRRHNG